MNYGKKFNLFPNISLDHDTINRFNFTFYA